MAIETLRDFVVWLAAREVQFTVTPQEEQRRIQLQMDAKILGGFVRAELWCIPSAAAMIDCLQQLIAQVEECEHSQAKQIRKDQADAKDAKEGEAFTGG